MELIAEYQIEIFCAIFVAGVFVWLKFKIPEPYRPLKPRSFFQSPKKWLFWWVCNWIWKKWYFLYYLHTWHWKRVRAAVLKRDKYKCRECGSTKHLQVHHTPKAYKFLFKELDGDNRRLLWTLCWSCHQHVHGR